MEIDRRIETIQRFYDSTVSLTDYLPGLVCASVTEIWSCTLKDLVMYTEDLVM